jgi:hypothetical protein
MSKEKYNLIMFYLDIIEAEWNKIAKELDHMSYEEFNKK